VERGVDVLESGGTPPPPRRRRWQAALLVLAALVLVGLAVRSALTHPHDAGRGVPGTARPGPTYLPDPTRARTAAGALPSYPGTVPPIGYLDAGKRFVGDYAAAAGRRVQIDAACAGTGQVVLSAYSDGGPSPSAASPPVNQPLAGATLLCTTAPNASTLSFDVPLGGRYQVIFAPGPATGVVAWRLVPWGS
jgi:hypothetical protein